MSFPHLVLFFPVLPLLVNRGVTTQAPSNNTSNNYNISNNTGKRNSNQKKYVAFNIKQWRIVFFRIELQKRKKHVMYVDGGHAIAAMSIYKTNLTMEETFLTKEF
jgi:hypothetical protein